MSRKMSSKIPSRIPPDDEEVVVNWSSGVVETNVIDARDSSVSNDKRNVKELERAKQQANDILGKCFNPSKGYPPEILQRVYDTSIIFEVEKRTTAKRLPESTKAEKLPESTKSEQLPEINNMDSGTRPQNRIHGRPSQGPYSQEKLLASQHVKLAERRDQSGDSHHRGSVKACDSLRSIQNAAGGFSGRGICQEKPTERQIRMRHPTEIYDENLSGNGAEASKNWPRNLIKEISQLVSAPSVAPKKPEIFFKMNIESAQKNFIIMKQHDLSLAKALQAQSGSPLDFGSKFKPVSDLKPIFGNHPNWNRMESILCRGSD